MADWRVGTSGFLYKHWRGVFYPDTIPQRLWFEHYARHFNTVELNVTFYRMPRLETFDNWASRAPKNFLYTLKFSRYGTHIKRLGQPDQTIATFLAGADRLGDSAGPILVQLPPKFIRDEGRLDNFLAAAPRRYRWAVEFRNPTWLCKEIYDLLGRHNAALVIHDLIPDHPQIVTADWVYLRFHGTNYAGNYPSDALSYWADRATAFLRQGLDVYAYFNNDIDGHAVHNAKTLRQLVRECLNE